MLFNRKQIAVLEEATPGTFNSSVLSATYAQFLAIEPSIEPEFQTYERQIQRNTMTPVPPLAGQRRARVRLSHELTGDASAGVPQWDRLVRGCGYRRETLRKITIGAITGGPFRHGELITQTTSLATARVFLDTHTGTTTLYVYSVTGSPTTTGGHTWVGGTSAASAQPSTVDSAAGYGWHPRDFPTATVTYATTPSPDVAVGDVFSGATSGAIAVVESVDTTAKVIKARVHNAKMFQNGETLGRLLPDTDTLGAASAVAQEDIPTLSFAMYDDNIQKRAKGGRGNMRIAATTGEVAMLTFEFTAAYETVTDSASLTGVASPFKVPPILLGVTLVTGSEGSTPSFRPQFNAFELDTGHQLAYRTSMQESSGILETVIVARNGSGSIDPEVDLESSFPFYGNWANQVIENMRVDIGSATANKFIIQCPGIRPTNIAGSNRDNIATYSKSFALTGGAMSNASNSANERNDLLLVYLTT